MNRLAFVILIALFSLDVAGYRLYYGAAPAGKPSSSKQKEEVAVQPPIYRNASLVTWEESQGEVVEARLQTLASRLERPPSGFSISVLTITNLATGKVIFKQDSQDSPISMYVRPINEDEGNALVIIWSGGSSDRMEILAVDATQAHEVFNEHYRLDAALISLSHETVDVLVTTANGGAQPLYTTRYSWKEGRYRPTSKVPYERLTSIITSEFNKKPSRHRTRSH